MGGPAAIDMNEYSNTDSGSKPEPVKDEPEVKKDGSSVGNIEELVETALSNNPAFRGFKVEVKGHEADEDGNVLVNCVVSPPPQETDIDVVINPEKEVKKEEA